MNANGGYVIVDLSRFNIEASAGSSTPVDVGAEIVEKFKQTKKPVLIDFFNFTLDGATVGVGGFTAHNVTAGAHNHYCGNYSFAVTGNTQITVTQL